MIEFRQGNLLEADADALVNTVNTVGVSGKGIALMFKEAFPQNFREYERASKANELQPGDLFITERNDMLGPRWIINFATKKHWRHPSRIEWIKHGLVCLRHEILSRKIQSVAIPPVGAGNGGLDWSNVRTMVIDALADLDCRVLVYEPTSQYQNVVKRDGVERLTPARAMMAAIIRRYEILGSECSILEAQKLAWFLAQAMRRLGLSNPIASDFAANRYGPYSEQVRHLLNSLDGSYLACERRVADARPFDRINFKSERADRLTAYLTTADAAPYRAAIDWVAESIDGFQSPHGLELLATIDWLHRRSNVPLDTDAMLPAIAGWPGPEGAAERKAKVFTRPHVDVAVSHLLSIEAAQRVA